MLLAGEGLDVILCLYQLETKTRILLKNSFVKSHA